LVAGSALALLLVRDAEILTVSHVPLANADFGGGLHGLADFHHLSWITRSKTAFPATLSVYGLTGSKSTEISGNADRCQRTVGENNDEA
jgi:hypothetical protein